MKPIPSEPLAKQRRVIGAFCDDLIDIAAGKMECPERTNAIREINRQFREREAGNSLPVNK